MLTRRRPHSLQFLDELDAGVNRHEGEADGAQGARDRAASASISIQNLLGRPPPKKLQNVENEESRKKPGVHLHFAALGATLSISVSVASPSEGPEAAEASGIGREAEASDQ